VNQGLEGVARIPAGTKDFNNDTFGAFSSLDMLPGSWHRNADGTYGGTLYALPDRGPNQIGSVGFSNYPGRVNIFSAAFTPYTGSAAISASANVLNLTQTGGFFLRDFNNNLTTGLDPGAPGPNAYVTENGFNLPGSKTGAAAGKISLDAEGLRFLQNGNFYVSDEYGANVYYFDPSGKMLGVIQPPPALIPRTSASGTSPDTLSYNSLADSPVGRRFNQGIEGMAIMPDQKHMVTLLQSATEQDSTSNQATRTNTRLMVYDISTTKTPTAPVADYVLQLPIYRSNGDGAAADRTAAQSEILALNDTQFLVLSRDGNGLGQANLPPVFKSILLVDTTGATNIAGTAYENSYTPISPGGVLVPSIVPVQQTELVNMLNTTQLGKFGINLNNAAGQASRTTLTEKWEGMTLVPVLDEAKPQDYFLLVGNDDDFLASNCNVGGENCAQSVNSDAMVLVYRLTLPTYVDPQFLQSMIQTGPAVLGMTEMAAHDLAVSGDLGRHFQDLRQEDDVMPAQLGGLPVTLWAGGGWMHRDESGLTTETELGGGTVGLDAHLGPDFLVGGAVGYYGGTAGAAGGLHMKPSAVQGSLYGAYQKGGIFAGLSGTYSDQQFRDIRRPAAYGMTGTGKTSGTGFAVTGEVDYMLEDGGLRFGPVAGFHFVNLDMDGYAESGAVGNVIFPGLHNGGTSGFFGGEGSLALGDMRALLRVTLNGAEVYDTGNATLVLSNAANAMGTQSVALADLGQQYLEPSIGLSGGGWLKWNLGYGAKIGMDSGVEHHVTLDARMTF
jgi:hypothetical protein